jgi:hypothetical protein
MLSEGHAARGRTENPMREPSFVFSGIDASEEERAISIDLKVHPRSS